jgi:hypothetical protein
LYHQRSGVVWSIESSGQFTIGDWYRQTHLEINGAIFNDRFVSIPVLCFVDQAELDSLGGNNFRETFLKHIIGLEALAIDLVFETIPEICVDI